MLYRVLPRELTFCLIIILKWLIYINYYPPLVRELAMGMVYGSVGKMLTLV